MKIAIIGQQDFGSDITFAQPVRLPTTCCVARKLVSTEVLR
jgi:hypothetical protein